MFVRLLERGGEGVAVEESGDFEGAEGAGVDLKIVDGATRESGGVFSPAKLQGQRFLLCKEDGFPERIRDDLGGDPLAIEVEDESLCGTGSVIGPGDEVPVIGLR